MACRAVVAKSAVAQEVEDAVDGQSFDALAVVAGHRLGHEERVPQGLGGGGSGWSDCNTFSLH